MDLKNIILNKATQTQKTATTHFPSQIDVCAIYIVIYLL